MKVLGWVSRRKRNDFKPELVGDFESLGSNRPGRSQNDQPAGSQQTESAKENIDQRNCEQEAVDPVEHASVAGQDCAHVFDPYGSLHHGLSEVTDRRDHPDSGGRDQGNTHANRFPWRKHDHDGSRYSSNEQPADPAFDGLLW